MQQLIENDQKFEFFVEVFFQKAREHEDFKKLGFPITEDLRMELIKQLT